MSDDKEFALIERAKSDPDAFGELYELYVDRIYGYIYYRVGNIKDAEDLTARVFMRVLKALPRYVDRGAPFSSWLYRIAYNLVANFHRDRARRSKLRVDALSDATNKPETPEEVVEREEDKEWLSGVIQKLNEDRQELLTLKFYQGLTNAEIGELMGRTEGAIKSLYHRTLVVLRQEWERHGIGSRSNRHR